MLKCRIQVIVIISKLFFFQGFVVVFIVDHVRRDWGQLVPNRGNKLKVWNVDNRKQFKKSGDVDYAKDGEN